MTKTSPPPRPTPYLPPSPLKTPKDSLACLSNSRRDCELGLELMTAQSSRNFLVSGREEGGFTGDVESYMCVIGGFRFLCRAMVDERACLQCYVGVRTTKYGLLIVLFSGHKNQKESCKNLIRLFHASTRR